MRYNNWIIGSMLMMLLLVGVGCRSEESILSNCRIVEKADKKIVVIENSTYKTGQEVVESIVRYEEMKSYGWWQNDLILGIPTSKKMEMSK